MKMSLQNSARKSSNFSDDCSQGDEESETTVSHSFEGFQQLNRIPSDAGMIEKLLPPPPLSPSHRQPSLMEHVDTVVVGDLGGTNSRLALYRIENINTIDDTALNDVGTVSAIYRNTYKNVDFSDFTQVLHQFLIDSQLPHLELVAGCLAVAGPVENDRVNFTNKNLWSIDGRRLEEEFVMPRESMRLVNDFVANGYGAVTLSHGDYEDISPFGPVDSHKGAPVACVGAGTGLGETYATAAGASTKATPRADTTLEEMNSDVIRYDAWPSEGGHVAFAPRDDLQREMLAYLADKFGGRVSTERVVSGKGIVNVYEFLAWKFPDKVNPRYDNDIRTAPEGAAIVAQGAYDDELCATTMDIFLDAYGAEVGNAAVKWIPKAGLYITGGIAGHNSDKIRAAESAFMEAYKDRGRMQPLLKDIPLRLVKIDDLGLRGAHYVALTILIERVQFNSTIIDEAKAAATSIKTMPSQEEIKASILKPIPSEATDFSAKKAEARPPRRASIASTVGLENSLKDLSKAVILGSSVMAATLAICTCLLLLKAR